MGTPPEISDFHIALKEMGMGARCFPSPSIKKSPPSLPPNFKFQSLFCLFYDLQLVTIKSPCKLLGISLFCLNSPLSLEAAA